MRRLDLLEAAAGAYANQILLAFSRSPLAADLLVARKPAWLARRHRLDPRGLEQLLQFVSLTTDVLRHERGRYRLLRSRSELTALRFQLEKFHAAYGPAVQRCLEALRRPGSARRLVDEAALGAAFAATGDAANTEVARVIEESHVECLLDLGCGTGSLLRHLALRNTRFAGIGVDAMGPMCRESRRAAREAGISDRIRTIHGLAPGVLKQLSSRSRARVEAIHGASFLNAFFGRGPKAAVRALRGLGRLFPGRKAWFVDYHGCLGTWKSGDPPLVNLLQDVAQIVSGQGFPPDSDASWAVVYRAAGCAVISQRQFLTDRTHWCLHEVRFPGEAKERKGEPLEPV